MSKDTELLSNKLDTARAYLEEFGCKDITLIETKNIKFKKELRDMCEQNICGMYNKSWMCPPYAGELDTLIENARKFEYGFLFSTIHKIKDRSDYAGMKTAGDEHNRILEEIKKKLNEEEIENLALGVGGCRVCEECSVMENKECRFPDRSISSISAYGISLSELCDSYGVNYSYGEDLLAYFGIILVR